MTVGRDGRQQDGATVGAGGRLEADHTTDLVVAAHAAAFSSTMQAAIKSPNLASGISPTIGLAPLGKNWDISSTVASLP